MVDIEVLRRRVEGGRGGFMCTRGFIPPETIRLLTTIPPSTATATKALCNPTTIQSGDVYAIGAVMRHVLTGVPPHLTISSYLSKLNKRLEMKPACKVTRRAIEGVRGMEDIEYGALKVMRDCLNTEVGMRAKVGEVLKSNWLKTPDPSSPTSLKKSRLKSILDRGDGGPVMITKPSNGESTGWGGVPGYIKDEFNRLMDKWGKEREEEEQQQQRQQEKEEEEVATDIVTDVKADVVVTTDDSNELISTLSESCPKNKTEPQSPESFRSANTGDDKKELSPSLLQPSLLQNKQVFTINNVTY